MGPSEPNMWSPAGTCHSLALTSESGHLCCCCCDWGHKSSMKSHVLRHRPSPYYLDLVWGSWPWSHGLWSWQHKEESNNHSYSPPSQIPNQAKFRELSHKTSKSNGVHFATVYKDAALEFREYRVAGDQEYKESNDSECERQSKFLREQEKIIMGESLN